MTLQQLPNAISIGRMLLVGPIVWALVTGAYTLAFWLFVIAGASDAADGYLARRFDWTSRTGALLDPAADKVLLVVTFVALAWRELAPWWLVFPVVARDLMITLMYLPRKQPVTERPTTLSKINTIAQVLGAALAILAAAGGVNAVLLETAFVMVLLTTVFSGVQYFAYWVRR